MSCCYFRIARFKLWSKIVGCWGSGKVGAGGWRREEQATKCFAMASTKYLLSLGEEGELQHMFEIEIFFR